MRYAIFFFRFLTTIVIAGSAFASRPVLADNMWNFALVSCNRDSNTVDIQEANYDNFDETGYSAPAGYQSKWLGSLVKYVSPPEGAPDDAIHGTHREKIADWRVSCRLSGHDYLIVVSPWSLNDMVQGQCGPGDPDLKLTVYRDKVLLINSQRFSYGGECMEDNGPSPFFSVKLSESRKEVTIGDIAGENGSKLPDFQIPYSQMPKFDQRKSQPLGYKPN